ncbi:MAG: hypothetical protein AUK34_15220 [Ignavibacteria bacterium CG2_30_36_16]|nr:MgtC/SapB family protein [Ignavibacteria bacterium]OIP54528.1 MAG: hypothetical protein AUK34_15220 [Ignavibacteria bacterium CG2_30_36_16]PJB00097.1 MAG: hypothetical protein CO127_09215 [Ignavibacteria bacterium CG_4_9_14_3_um_filter_36_18]
MTETAKDSVIQFPEQIFSNGMALGTDDLYILIQKLGIAILIGVLVGIEREHSRPKEEKMFAGIRTFPLISIAGFLAALISSFTSFWVYIAVFTGFAALVTTSHVFSARGGKPGGTSEMSELLVFILGGLVYWNFIIIAAIVSVIVTVFLSLKIQLHSFVNKLGEEDIFAALKLAVISIIIFPLLPDRAVDPLNILNPRHIWLMVIFISGISFAGYLIIKFFGRNKGIQLTGLMGGAVSSTAVAFSLARRSKANEELGKNLAAGIILASTVMYPRVFFVILILDSSMIAHIWVPLLLFTVTGTVVSYIMKSRLNGQAHEEIELKNPFELKSALFFGLIFGAVIFLSKAAELYLGSGGIYAASALAGLTSVDAIVLSLLKLSSKTLSADIAVAAIIIALISNTIVKLIITLTIGKGEIKKYTLRGLGALLIVSAVYLAFLLAA